MRSDDLYDILGVARDADTSAIKAAYRRLAMRYHPDKNPGDAEAEERFKKAAEAYAVLSDPEKRRRYDQFGMAGLGERPSFHGFDPDIFGDFSDILGDLFGFGDLFGRGRRARRTRRGSDLRYDLELDLEEAASGMEARIQVPRLEACRKCGGRGSDSPEGIRTCPQCRGRGQVAFQQGFFTVARTCRRCGGAGRVIVHPCPECSGKGRVRRERTLTVRIPAGVDEGSQLRLAEEGEASGAGGRPGDLYVVVHVKEHPVFRREGTNLACEVPVTFSQAALGAAVEVPTLNGEERLEIPAGTQPGTVFRLPGKGMPSLHGRGRGDLLVRVMVRTPERLTAEQRELFRRLAELEEPASGDRTLFDRVKDIFH